MTISSQVRTAGPFTGNGATTVFPFAFKVFQASDLLVARTDTGQVQTTLALSADYTVALNSDQNASPGGYVTLPAALPLNYSLTITSNIALLQPLSLTNQGGFFPKNIEDELDRLTILQQQLGFNVSQTLRVPEIGGASVLPAATVRANRILGFDGNGTPTAIVPTPGDASALALDLASTNVAAKGSGQVGFNATLSYVLGTLGARLRERVSVKDFPWSATGDGVTVDQAAITAADAVAAAAGKALTFPAGAYVLNANITFASRVVMERGAQIVATGNTYVLFNGGFDAPPEFCLNVSGYTNFLKTPQLLPQWFGAMGDAVYCTGSITSGTATLNCSAPAGGTTPGFNNGDTIFVRGAGAGGAILATTVVSGAGTLTLTLAANASTTVTSAEVASRDNTTALQRFFAAFKGAANPSVYGAGQPSATGCSKGYFSHGIYVSFAQINHYSGVVIEGEYGNTIGGAILVQANISAPLINVIADNFDKTGASTNGGSGNNIFRYLGFKSAKVDDTQLNAPVVYFQNAWNIHSDSEFDHCLWQGTAGACIGAGFQTTGSITTGTTALTLANGSTLRNGDNAGGRVTIKGAGVSGADLVTYIVSGGGTNNVVLNTAASTTVTGAVVYPTGESLGLKVNDCEFDVCRAGIELIGGVSGSVIITNLEAFEVVRGAIRNTSVGDMLIQMDATTKLIGCGNPYNTTAAYRRSIYMDTGGVTKGALILTGTTLEKLVDGTFTGGGPIYFQGKTFSAVGCALTDLDSNDLQKFMLVIADRIKIRANTFTTNLLNSYTNSRPLSFSNAATTGSLDCADNTFINTNGTAIATWVHSDYTIEGRNFTGNSFFGAATTVFDPNISNLRNQMFGLGTSPTFKIGTAAPGGGTYNVGDIVWNAGITNAAGQAVGFVCVVGGTPGTWRSFGVTV